MPLLALGWLVVGAVLAHNIEEALYLPAWSHRGGRWHAPVKPFEFRFAVSILSLLLVLVAALATWQGYQSVPAYLFAGYVFAMVVNVLLPHVAASIALRSYMPGTGTALLLNLPLGGLFLFRALKEGFVVPQVFAWSAPLTALGILASIPLLFILGRRLAEEAKSAT